MGDRTTRPWRALLVALAVAALSSLAGGAAAADWGLYGKGLAAAKQGDLRTAVATLTELFKDRANLSKGQQLKVSVALARLYLKAGKKDSAAKLVAFAERLAPNNETVTALRAAVGGAPARDATDLVETFETAELNERVSPGAGKDDMVGLIGGLQAALAETKDDPRLQYALGVCLMQRNGPDDGAAAEKALLRATELDSGRMEAWERLGTLYGRQGQDEKEAACYRRSIDGGSASGSVFAAMARNLARRGATRDDTDEMVKYVVGAVKDDPSCGDGIADLIQDEAVKSRVEAVVREAYAAAERKRAAEERQAQAGSSSGGSSSGGRSVTIPKMDGRTKASPKKSY